VTPPEPGDGEGRAWDTTREEVNRTTIGLGVKQADILFEHGPRWSILTKRLAWPAFDFDERRMFEPGIFDAERLAARTRADFQ